MILEALIATQLMTAAATTTLYMDSVDKQTTINKLTKVVNSNTKNIATITRSVETNQKAIIRLLGKR